MRRNVIGAVLMTILVLGALGAAAFGFYQLGYHQGLVETGTEVVVHSPGPGFYPGHWGLGGFWGFGLFFKFLFLFLIIGLIARLFFGRRHWGPGPYWAKDWHDEGASPMEQRLADWHEKAHGDRPAKPDSDPGV
ncbi:MAG TPA: hypothetical protein VFL72_06895 [Acidimicrobiia bacterium]|nr:hypothetical protein [Acidimicrobiia bacterium]